MQQQRHRRCPRPRPFPTQTPFPAYQLFIQYSVIDIAQMLYIIGNFLSFVKFYHKNFDRFILSRLHQTCYLHESVKPI